MSERQNARQFIKRGVAAARQDNRAEAVRLLSRAVQLDDTNPDGWYWLGRVVPDIQKKAECMQNALKLDPEHERAKDYMLKLRATGRLRLPQEFQEPKLAEDEDVETPAPSRQEPEPEPEDDDDPFAAAMQADDDDDPFASIEADDDDDPFAGVETLRESEQPERSRSQAEVAAREAASRFRQELTADKVQGLIPAWLAALRFDNTNSYDARREEDNPVGTAIMMGVVLALAPFLLLLATGIALVIDGVSLDFGEFLGQLARSIPGSILFAVQSVAALWVASFVSSYVARTNFQSDIKTSRHFTLSGLFVIPTTVALVVLVIVLGIVGFLLGEITTFFGQSLIPGALSYTGLLIFGYVIVQFVFSNSAIHRVKTWPAVVISVVSLATAGLVIAWLAPITIPLVSGGV